MLHVEGSGVRRGSKRERIREASGDIFSYYLDEKIGRNEVCGRDGFLRGQLAGYRTLHLAFVASLLSTSIVAQGLYASARVKKIMATPRPQDIQITKKHSRKWTHISMWHAGCRSLVSPGAERAGKHRW